MSFTSLSFLPFIALLTIGYWLLIPKKASAQNLLLLAAGLFFIAYNDWKAAIIIGLSGSLNFFLVQRMASMKEGAAKKWFFYGGCAWNLSLLVYFKYLQEIITAIGIWIQSGTLDTTQLYLPLGISFFSFQLVGYWIDVYNEETEPEDDFPAFLTYLFYFPKLISGPIERVQNLVPQLKTERTFSVPVTTDGLRQFLWGFFKKTVVSTHCLLFYKVLYTQPESMSGINLMLAAIINMVYIYADFSGYSDMACGVSKGLGIRITNNFAFPFFATNISDFWKRWHISLTTWIMNYVYTPISFIMRKHHKIGTFVAILAAFTTVGVWHGIKSGYLIYGILQALFFVPLILQGRSMNGPSHQQKLSLSKITRMFGLFMLVCIAALLFRPLPALTSMNEMTLIVTHLFQAPDFSAVSGVTNGINWFLIVACFAIEWINQNHDHGLDIARLHGSLRWCYYLFCILAIFFFSEFPNSGFIYAQF
jgi:D-alanyl-lipoteichoic acid acyltransferase DltB (MBOAT superfamily)